MRPVLTQSGEISPNAQAQLSSLCLPEQVCQPDSSNSPLQQIVNQGYSLQLLNHRGETVAAIGQHPESLPSNSKLLAYHTQNISGGKPYHFHLMPLRKQSGEMWGYLQVGQSVGQFDEYMDTLHLLLIFGIPFAMILIGGASWWLAGLAMQPIYQSYAQMQQFTADAAHELRTPIATMQATIESTLAASDTAAETTQTLTALQRQNQRLKHLTQDMLLLTRLENDSTSITQERICLNEVIEDLEEELLPLALAANIHFQCHVPANGSKLWLKGDAGQIYRLISNLITNAINYTPSSGNVTVSLISQASEAIIQVQDTGIGIPAEELPHLYARFYRVNQDRGRKTGGSGLGLSIAQTIAQKHGGRITATSTLGQGSQFQIHLPLA
ncbi:two-component sensor histidine kinase [filamentous cyanobacterium LEGE 11480]|uniref:histidine kinase n=2 Tax=Romeriopsis TaxID=2992131 RepID=A0A928Z4K8_9CYAN|nr:two-component sensor histidine kinase [Romeriopsis navalis LEGE 11480]